MYKSQLDRYEHFVPRKANIIEEPLHPHAIVTSQWKAL